MENKVATLEEPSKETYGFKSKHHPSQSKYLEAFEKDLFNMANSLRFRRVRNDFQQKSKKTSHRLNHLMTFLYSQTKPTIYISHHQKNIKNCYSII